MLQGQIYDIQVLRFLANKASLADSKTICNLESSQEEFGIESA